MSAVYKKTLIITGLVLIVVGLVALFLPMFTFTSQEELIKLGPFHATSEVKKHFAINPLLGIGVTVLGFIVGILGLVWKKT
jgi:uncharacterized membrane protein HdeD (DUF308 family)